ncbi:hypothetical protein QBC43DRAFT_327583 [Cladorrhinum sp. PSN259]|nr:hypothetical protein QBC43DRAFT_327583 [Cladorrhinum sp. PSN259]
MPPTLIRAAGRLLAPRFAPGENSEPLFPSGSPPAKTKSFPFTEDGDDDDEGLNIHPAEIAGIVVSIVIFFLITTCFCVYKDRRRRRLAQREKQVEIALKQSPSPPVPVPRPVVLGTNNNLSINDHHDAPPPPYEAAHVANRHPEVVHQWNRDPRGGGLNTEEDITGANSTVTDGIPPEGGKKAGLRIGS